MLPNNHKATNERRIRMAHALKLYYNRLHVYLSELTDENNEQKEYLIREASETLLMIENIESKIES